MKSFKIGLRLYRIITLLQLMCQQKDRLPWQMHYSEHIENFWEILNSCKWFLWITVNGLSLQNLHFLNNKTFYYLSFHIDDLSQLVLPCFTLRLATAMAVKLYSNRKCALTPNQILGALYIMLLCRAAKNC